MKEMNIKVAQEIVRDFGFLNFNKDLVVVERLPQNWREVKLFLQAIEVLCEDLEKQRGYIVTLEVGVSDSLSIPSNISSAFSVFMANIPEWAGISSKDVLEFAKAIVRAWNLRMDEGITMTLDGLIYNQRTGWNHNN